MSVCTANFETGTNGNNIATSDTGSATAWDAVSMSGSDSIKYSNAHPAFGTLGAHINNLVGDGPAFMKWQAAYGTVTEDWGRFYAYMTSYGSGDYSVVAGALNGSDTASANICARIDIGTNGKLRILDKSGTDSVLGSVALALNQMVRIEYHFLHSTTVGVAEVKLFNTASSITPDDTLTSPASWNTLASADRFFFGVPTTGYPVYDIYIDQIIVGASAYPGPYPVNTTPCTVSGSTPVGSTLTANAGSWNSGGTFTLTYQWQRDGSNIGGATGTTYVTQAGDVGHAIGVLETATGIVATSEAASHASSNTITPTGGSSAKGGALLLGVG